MSKVCLYIFVFMLLYFSLTASALGGTAMLTQYIPIKCDVNNDYVAIETIKMGSISTRKAKRREIDFSSDGITLRTSVGIPTAADYSDVESITYLKEEGNERGLFTLNFRAKSIIGQRSMELGYVQTACWDALMAFFKRKNININVDVKKADPAAAP